MKKPFLVIVCICLVIYLQAQVSKTVNINTGGLYSALTITERNTITNLKITGTIDASDFKTLRDYMSELALLDISGTFIAAYIGQLGTSPSTNITSYPENKIPIKALFNCKKLISITIPSSITSIGENAFDGCSGLTSLTIPSSVTSVEDYAFNMCSGLISFSIPSSVNSIGNYTFNGCTKLTSLTIPNSVTRIGNRTFGYCYGLTSFSIPSSVTSIGVNAFVNCDGLTSIEIPSSVTSIGEYAFYGCTGLTSISIPSSVTYIGKDAFYDCGKLNSIYAYSKVPVDLMYSNYFFNVNKNTCILYVPIGSINAYRIANVWKDFRNVEGISTTDLKLINSNQISIYPNPVTDGFHVNGLMRTSILQLFDINGKLLHTLEIDKNEYVSISNLPHGIYIVRINSEAGIFEKKLEKR